MFQIMVVACSCVRSTKGNHWCTQTKPDLKHTSGYTATTDAHTCKLYTLIRQSSFPYVYDELKIWAGNIG